MSVPTDGLYADLHNLPLTVRVAWHEAQAHPEQAEAIFTRMTAELRRLSFAASMHLQNAEAQMAARTNAMERASEAAERKIRVALSNIAGAGIDDGFNPRGYYVYCLWGTGTDCPMYVGLSRNILARLGSHLGNPQRRHSIERVTLIRCATERIMVATEARLIREHQPPWNILGIIPQENAA